MPRLAPIRNIAIYDDNRFNYNTFPSVVKREDGSLIIAFRQARDWFPVFGEITHGDPASAAVTLTSHDGELWSEECEILYDDFLRGVQDPCLNTLRDGTLFGTLFMWKFYEKADVKDERPYDHAVFDNWLGRFDRAYTIKSGDGGATWDDPIPAPFAYAAVRGSSVEMEDGSILVPFYAEEAGTSNVIIARTADRGETWVRLATIEGCDGHHFYEPSLLRTNSGKLVVFIRSMNKQADPGTGEPRWPLYTSESRDNGLTWSRPAKRKLYSPSPFHGLRLDSGHILLTYGNRIGPPWGIKAVVLDPECGDWERIEETTLRDDAADYDIGYTSSVQLEDGRVLVVYYYGTEGSRRSIEGTLCEVVE